MNWDDDAYLLSKNRYSENSIIAEVFSEYHGKISGIIFGGTSKKIVINNCKINLILGLFVILLSANKPNSRKQKKNT